MAKGKKSPLRPLNDCVLVEPEQQEDYAAYKKMTHIVIPDQFSHGPEDRTPWGKVLACGPGCHGIVQAGDRVAYGKFSWAKLEVDDKKYLAVVRERDLLIKESPYALS